MPMMQYDPQKLKNGYEISTDMCQVIQYVEEVVDEDKVQFDKRIQENYSSQFEKINSIDLVEDVNSTVAFSNWLSEKISQLEETIEETTNNDIDIDTGGGGGYYPVSGVTGTSGITTETGTTTISGLSSEVIDNLKEKLKELGYTDAEIEKILSGQMPVDQITFDKLTSALEGLGEDKKTFYQKLADVLGCSILNADGTLNKDLFAIAMLMAQKGLGMEINMSDGSEFKTYLQTIATKLEELYKSDSSIRNKIKEKYGIDIFNDDGTVNIDRLALVKILDGMDKSDDYDLEKMFGIMSPTTTPLNATTEPETNPISTVPEVPNSPTTEPPSDLPSSPATNPPSSTEIVEGQGTEQTGSSHASNLVSSINKDSQDASKTTEDETDDKDNKGILKALENGVGALSKKIGTIKPVEEVARIVKTKGANVSVIAVASLAAGGAAAGGGVLMSKKLKTTTFTPDDWAGLAPETQSTVELLMKNVGFTKEECKEFKKATFKISTEELSTHENRISDIVKDNEESLEAIEAQYGYQIADVEGTADEYLLFITMIIDGKNNDDNYNIYNVINMGIDEDEVDYYYDGINMEDYITDEEPDQMEDELSFDTYNDSDIEAEDNKEFKANNIDNDGFDSNHEASTDDDSTLTEW